MKRCLKGEFWEEKGRRRKKDSFSPLAELAKGPGLEVPPEWGGLATFPSRLS